jgi:hypothetical protein
MPRPGCGVDKKEETMEKNIDDVIKSLENKKEGIAAECANFEGGIQRELDLAYLKGMEANYIAGLEAQLSSAKERGAKLLERVDSELTAAKEALIQKQQALQEQSELNAENVKQQIKEELRSAWVLSGGDPANFEAAFDDLYTAEIKKRTLAKLDEDKKARARQFEKARRIV